MEIRANRPIRRASRPCRGPYSSAPVASRTHSTAHASSCSAL